MPDYSVPKDIAEYLEDQTIGTVGTDIFAGFMPDDPDNCIAIYQYAGNKPDLGQDLDTPGVQIVIRNSVLATALTKAKTVFDTLHEATWITSMESGKSYYYIEATGMPMQTASDKKGLHHIIINFMVTKET